MRTHALFRATVSVKWGLMTFSPEGHEKTMGVLIIAAIFQEAIMAKCQWRSVLVPEIPAFMTNLLTLKSCRPENVTIDYVDSWWKRQLMNSDITYPKINWLTEKTNNRIIWCALRMYKYNPDDGTSYCFAHVRWDTHPRHPVTGVFFRTGSSHLLLVYGQWRQCVFVFVCTNGDMGAIRWWMG